MSGIRHSILIFVGFLAYAACGLAGSALWPEDVVGRSIVSDLCLLAAFCPLSPFYRSVQDRTTVGHIRWHPFRWAAVLSVLWAVVQLTTTVLVSSGVGMGVYGNLVELPSGSLAAYAVLSIVLAPACEELFVRRFLFGHLLSVLPCGAAVFVQAVLFGLMHGSAIHLYSATVTGLFFGAVYLYTGRIFPCMAIHSLYNLGCLAFQGAELPSFLFNPLFLLICNGVLLFGAAYLCLWCEDRRTAAENKSRDGA